MQVLALIKRMPYLRDHIRTRGTKPKGESIVTSMLTVQPPYVLRVIFRKLKKLVRNDKELEEMKKERTLHKLHPRLEPIYDKLADKTSRNDKNSDTRDLFDKLCDRTCKLVIEEFFKDDCCRYLFRRFW
jgi:hypothetical protein